MITRFPIIEVEVVADDPIARVGLLSALSDVDGVDAFSAGPRRTEPSTAPRDGHARRRVILWDSRPVSHFESTYPVVALVDDAHAAQTAVAAGAAGVLRRGGDVHRMSAAIRAAANGLGVHDRSLGPALAMAEAPEPLTSSLTPREHEVLDLVVQGLSNRRIARRLGISAHTAKFHVDRLLDKLDARTRTDVAVRAIRGGLVAM